jgi:Uma2 family endonuclease
MTANLKLRDDTARKYFLPDFPSGEEDFPCGPKQRGQRDIHSEKDIPYEEEEFPYGWRRFAEILPGGSVRYLDIPLTPEDFLDPQEGDQMPQGPEHGKIAADIYGKLQKYYRNSPDTAVFFDVKMRWGIPGLKEPFPDISVVPGIRETENLGASFDVKKHGTRPCLIVEIVSPRYAEGDTAKADIYEQAGVQEYIIVNPHTENTAIPFELTGYRLVRGKYRKIFPDSEGQLLSKTTGLLFGIEPEGRQIALTDSISGEKLLSNKEEINARILEAEAREKAEARAEQEARARENAEAEILRLKAELARLKRGSD